MSPVAPITVDPQDETRRALRRAATLAEARSHARGTLRHELWMLLVGDRLALRRWKREVRAQRAEATHAA